jgi:hypothetical protein
MFSAQAESVTSRRAEADPGRDPPGPGRHAPSTVVFAALLGLLAAGCGEPPDREDVPGDGAAPVPTAEPGADVGGDVGIGVGEEASGPERAARARRRAASGGASPASRVSAVPHDAHGEVQCGTCHASVPGHGSHGALACGECHEGAGDRGAALTAAECLACHHDPGRADRCDRCHERSDLPRGTVPVAVRVSVRDEPVSRALPFEHARHRGVECQTCHTGLPARSVGVACDACHDRHHNAEAVCSRCHEPVAAAPHGERAHTGCGGGGCHRDESVLRLPATRPFCLTCHRDQEEHEAPDACVACHIPGFTAAGAGAAGAGPAPGFGGRSP